MMKKWYFGFFITALAFLVIVQHDAVVSNQEIVLEFVNTDIASPEAQDAITKVKKQLHAIGAKNTRVVKGAENGTLKITYYSDADVSCIKSLLSKEQKAELDPITYDQKGDTNEFPLDKSSKKYNFNVYEIQKNADFEVDFNSIALSDIQQEQDGFSKPNDLYTSTSDIGTTYADILAKVAQKAYATKVVSLDTTSHKIPEVRAGPAA